MSFTSPSNRPLGDHEFPDDDDIADSDELDVRACPECGRWIVQDAEMCRYCGHWFLESRGGGELGSGYKRLIWSFAVGALLWVILVVWNKFGQ